ncbi:9016_t:CDS:2 [Diversispora eburnea]|uniref:9016_t:CDS:1 n=1 Tax=Diversispora eburnea TaxID=1213867 RepID=A0A9N8YLC7_9GLOM|nr:9016_t:CDS:2 [Diversispora eburnea]
MAQTPKSNFQHMKDCMDSSAACLNCAEHANSEGCARTCRINAELASCTAKLISLNAPQVNTLVDLTIKSSQDCAEICIKHNNDHCQTCAHACQNLAENLRQCQT